MKKRLVILVIGVVSFFAAALVAHASFSDVRGHKYQAAVDFIQSRGIVKGYSDGTFRPDRKINRAELLTIIIGQKYQNFSSMSCFTDVFSNQWYAKFVCKGKELGIVRGYADGAFKPEQNVNFVEALIMVQRAHNIPIDTSISPWYKKSVESANQMNMIPFDIASYDVKITRGQMAEIMMRIIKFEKDTPVEPPPIPSPIPQPVRMQTCTNEVCKTINIDYMIISRPLFEDALQTFIAWKQNNGFRVGFITVDYIDQNYTGMNIAEKMKAVLKEYSMPVKYFLLVGDTEVNRYDSEFKWTIISATDVKSNIEGLYDLTKPWNVPSGYIDLQFANSRSMMISDLYYADLDNWDVDGDGILDTQKGTEIFDFETIVGRWPVRTQVELNRVIQKTINMKPTNLLAFWGSYEWRSIYNQQDIDTYCTNISSHFLETGSVTIECVMYLIFGNSSKISYAMNYVPQEELASGNLNFASFFFNTRQAVYGNFHGSLFSIDGVTVDDVNKFTQIIPLYVPQSCAMVHYFLKYSDALSEALIKAEKGPAVFAIPPNQYAFFKSLTEGKTVGEAFYPKEKKWQLNKWYSTLFGDPSLKIFSL